MKKIMKEWRPATNAYRRIYLVIIISAAYVTYSIYPHDQQTAYITGALTLYYFGYIVVKTWSIKQVRFTYDSVIIGHKKIDLMFLKSIDYVKNIKMGRNIDAIEFCISFLPNRIYNEKTHFYMKFNKGGLRSLFCRNDYDYYDDFINILLDRADERKRVKSIGRKV